MEDNKIRIGITQGDINGVGYEVILKTFSDPTMLELCTPIIYGSPKVAAYHRKALDVQTNFSIINTASEAGCNRLSVVNCTDDEVKVEFSKPDPEAGKAALGALERAIEDYREGLIDVIVTAPINKHTIQSEEFSFPGHTEYIEERLGNGNKSLMILMKNDFRVALVTTHIPVREIATTITKELIHLSSLPEAGFRHRCSAYCGVVSQSSCRRRRFAGYGRTGSDYPCHEGNGGKGDSLLRTLCCRRLYGIGQLYAFRRNIGDVPRPGAGSVQGVGYG